LHQAANAGAPRYAGGGRMKQVLSACVICKRKARGAGEMHARYNNFACLMHSSNEISLRNRLNQLMGFGAM